MKIGMISHWFDPEGGAAAGPGTIARALRDRDHDVHVVTGFPTYPAGRVFDGYRIRPYQREALEGVTVHRSAIYPSHDTRAAHRAANYLSFAASGSAVAARVLRDVDVAFVYSTPATVAIPAMATRALRKVPFVVQIQDLWPQTVTSSGFLEEGSEGRAERLLHRFCDTVYRQARTVAVTSPGMADLIAARGIDRAKITFVPNWADESAFYPSTPDPDALPDVAPRRDFSVMYAGNLGEMQSLDTMVEAAALLRDRSDIEFVLVGAGVAETRLRQQVADLALDNVRFVAPQPFERMASVLALGDTQVVSLKDAPLFASTLPSKLQANMAAGRPIIGALTGDAARVVTESGAGDVCAPGDARSLEEAVRRQAGLSPSAREELGHRARRFYLDHFSEQVVGDRLSEVLAEAAGRGRA